MVDKYNIEFQQLLQVANNVATWLTVEDGKLARKWIDKVKSYQSQNPDLARVRNELMENLVQILRQELTTKALSTRKGVRMSNVERSRLMEELNSFGEPGASTSLVESVYKPPHETTNFMSVWSRDKRTYIAAKPIGGVGALIYIAVTPHPELGWDLPDPAPERYQHPTRHCQSR